MAFECGGHRQDSQARPRLSETHTSRHVIVMSPSRHRHDHQPPPQHSETQSSRHVAVTTINPHPSTLKHRAHVTSPLRPSNPTPHPPLTHSSAPVSPKQSSGHVTITTVNPSFQRRTRTKRTRRTKTRRRTRRTKP